MRGAVGKADEFERLQRSFSAFLGWDAGVDKGQLDVLQGTGAWDQVEALEDEPDLAVAHDRELVLVEVKILNDFNLKKNQF